MKRLAIVILVVCLCLIPVVILLSKEERPVNPERKQDEPVVSRAKEADDAGVREDPPVAAKARPEIADQLPPGSKLEDAKNGGCMVTLPGVGVYLANGVTVAERGLVFKGPIAFALTKEGPWVGYAGEGVSMHLAKDGTTKLSGESAIMRENMPAPAAGSTDAARRAAEVGR